MKNKFENNWAVNHGNFQKWKSKEKCLQLTISVWTILNSKTITPTQLSKCPWPYRHYASYFMTHDFNHFLPFLLYLIHTTFQLKFYCHNFHINCQKNIFGSRMLSRTLSRRFHLTPRVTGGAVEYAKPDFVIHWKHRDAVVSIPIIVSRLLKMY